MLFVVIKIHIIYVAKLMSVSMVQIQFEGLSDSNTYKWHICKKKKSYFLLFREHYTFQLSLLFFINFISLRNYTLCELT